MPNSIISEGKTTNEAIEKGLKKLNVDKTKVNIKVLESEDKRSFFSILAPRIVKVELTLKEEDKNIEKIEKKSINKPREAKTYSEEELKKAKNNVEKFLEKFLKTLGNDAKYEVLSNENSLNITILGEETSALIGYRGETLYSMQNILVAIASKGQSGRIKVILDIDGYKEKREKTLEDLAEKIAKTVVRTGKSITLEPMKAYERKIIHSKLKNSNKVLTKSIGEEPRRRIMITLK